MEKDQAVDDHLFPQFGNLPKEIRLEIWEAALPGPRIVELRERPFKIGNLLNRNHRTPKAGFKSYCRALDILFACRESHEVAIKHYERAFDIAASHPGTWF
jgi:hypothetical protein